VFVVLYEDGCLIVEIRVCHRQETVVPNLCGRVTHIPHHCNKGLINNRNWVFPDNDAFQIIWFHLGEPFMLSDILDSEACLGVGVQNFLD
jgi:hypothetical protein